MSELTEILGFTGSLLVVISLMMSNTVKLRVFSLSGALLFLIYGLIIMNFPVIILNAALCIINIYHLIRIKSEKISFDLVNIPKEEDALISRFLSIHYEDIKFHFPIFDRQLINSSHSILIFRNLKAIGLFVYRLNTPDSVEVLCDYVIPEVRDMKNSEFLYNHRISQFRNKGFKKLYHKNTNPRVINYLKKLGYKKREEFVYEKEL